VRGIERDSRWGVSRELLNGDLPARRNVAVVVDTPGANGGAGAGHTRSSVASADNPAVRRISLYSRDSGHQALRALNDRLRLGISAGGAIEDQHGSPAVDDQEIVHRIDGNRGHAANLSVGSAEHPFRRDVSVRCTVKDQNSAWSDGKQDLVVHGIDADLIKTTGIRA